MDELKFMECSPPIPAQLGDVTIPTNSFTSSSEGEEDPSFPEKSVLASQVSLLKFFMTEFLVFEFYHD